jgi:chromatin remodeling complex protein RSC6
MPSNTSKKSAKKPKNQSENGERSKKKPSDKDNAVSGDELLTTILERQSNMLDSLKENIRDLKTLSKVHAKEKKVKRKRALDEDGNPRKTGVTAEVPVPKPLLEVLGLKKSDMMSRVQVASKIFTYCKDKGLQDENNKRNYVMDSALAKAFGEKKKTEFTITSIQTLLKKLYPPSKSSKATPAKKKPVDDQDDDDDKPARKKSDKPRKAVHDDY